MIPARASLAVVVATALGAVAVGACSTRATPPSESPSPEAIEAARLDPLRGFERELRSTRGGAHAPADVGFGADPWAIRRLPVTDRTARYVGILRGRGAVVLLDASLAEIARAPAPRSTTGLAVRADGSVLVSGDESGALVRYATRGDALVRLAELRVDAEGIRDVATHGDEIAALDARGARVFVSSGGAWRSYPTCAGGVSLARTPSALVTTCAAGHVIDVVPVRGGEPDVARRTTLKNDGPFFGVAVEETSTGGGTRLSLVAGAVEDHPLDRREGSFGFVDSIVRTFSVDLERGGAREGATVNVSERGLVTPKALVVSGEQVWVAGYGTTGLASFALATGAPGPSRALPPGVRALEPVAGGFVAADPLLDAWVRVDEKGTVVVPARDDAPPRSLETRLGEALIFTTAIAPFNKSAGRLSRFTCETCHFEGGVDGRVHHTGRGDVVATTKPILGLYNNRPFFTRALDPDFAALAMNEFRAANAKSDHDPYFELRVADAPWLTELGIAKDATFSPEALRRAFIEFLYAFDHRPNPRAASRRTFTAAEARGAEVFRGACESCHEAKVAAEASARVPFADWERLIMAAETPLVFADARYEKTGVVPYVHEAGARVTSLRRIYAKRPYFTNGSAPDLDAVIERARLMGDQFFHDGAPPRARPAVSRDDARALRAFLDLL